MLSAINPTTNFESRKFAVPESQDVSDLKAQARKVHCNTVALKGAYLAGSAVGLCALNKYAAGKSFMWNKELNTGLKKAAAEVYFWTLGKYLSLSEKSPKVAKFVDKAGTKVKDGLMKIRKMPARTKLLIAGAAVALAGYETLVALRGRKEGKIAQKIEDAKAAS